MERGKSKCVDERKGIAGMARKQETFPTPLPQLTVAAEDMCWYY